jgi:hypothetical protein
MPDDYLDFLDSLGEGHEKDIEKLKVRLLNIENYTGVAVITVEDRAWGGIKLLGPVKLASVRIMTGAHSGKTVWTGASGVVRLVESQGEQQEDQPILPAFGNGDRVQLVVDPNYRAKVGDRAFLVSETDELGPASNPFDRNSPSFPVKIGSANCAITKE